MHKLRGRSFVQEFVCLSGSFSTRGFALLCASLRSRSQRAPLVHPSLAGLGMPPLSVLRAIVERNIAQVRELQLAGEKKKRSRRYRHGGFHPKPHQPVGEKPQDKWRRRAEDSPWYEKYLENPETYDQNSWYGKRFAELFIVPRLVYDELLEQIRDVPGYCDKKLPQEVQRWVSFAGTGKQGGGAGVQPLELKLLASLMRLRGTKFKVIEESACISALCASSAFTTRGWRGTQRTYTRKRCTRRRRRRTSRLPWTSTTSAAFLGRFVESMLLTSIGPSVRPTYGTCARAKRAGPQ